MPNAATNKASVAARIRFGVSQVMCRAWSHDRAPLAPAAAAITHPAHMDKMVRLSIAPSVSAEANESPRAALESGRAPRCRNAARGRPGGVAGAVEHAAGGTRTGPRGHRPRLGAWPGLAASAGPSFGRAGPRSVVVTAGRPVAVTHAAKGPAPISQVRGSAAALHGSGRASHVPRNAQRLRPVDGRDRDRRCPSPRLERAAHPCPTG